MTETTDRFPARSARLFWHGHISLILFVCATAASVAGCAILGRMQYRHAIALYVGAQYAIVLPSLLWFLRSNRTASPTAFSVGDYRLAAAAVLGVLAIGVALSYDHGHTIPDESAYQFQARIFASGHVMAAPLPGIGAVGLAMQAVRRRSLVAVAGGLPWSLRVTRSVPTLAR